MKDYRNYKCGAKPSPIDSRDYQVKDILAGSMLLPEEFILEAPMTAFDQGQSSMCVACTGANLKYSKEYYQSGIRTRFSPAYLYANREDDMYHGEGMYPREMLKILQKYGCCTERSFPGFGSYEELYHEYLINKDNLDTEAHPYRIDSYYRINSIEEAKQVLLQLGGSITAMFPVYKYMYEIDKNTGIIQYIPSQSQQIEGYHQMLIIGYNSSGWIVQNSWGDEWGISIGNGSSRCVISYDFPIIEMWTTVDNINEIANINKVAQSTTTTTKGGSIMKEKLTKLIEYIKSHKTQILSVIAAVTAAALALQDFGGETAKICEIVVALDSILVIGLTEGFNAAFISKSVALIKLLQELFGSTPNSTNTKKVASAAQTKLDIAKMSDEDIKKLVIKYLK